MIICPVCGYMETAKKRSIQQNRAYFGIAVEMIAKQCNSSKDAMHKALAGEFLGFDTVEMPDGKVITVPKSTKELNTKEFMAYVEKIQRWAAENGISIPNPNEPPLKDY